MAKAAANRNETRGNVEDLFELDKSAEKTIATRDTDELVVAMVGPVASGVSTTAEFLKKIFIEKYGYAVDYIKISKLIESSAHLVDIDVTKETEKAKRIEVLQSAGTALRERYSSSYLAEKVIQKIALDREANGGFQSIENDRLLALPRRNVTIIDSLKKPI